MLIAAIGNPNTGKSTVFNALTGLNQKVANYPGVTVERHAGRMQLPGGQVELIDLPGTYSLAAQSPDEMVAIDVLLGRIADGGQPQAVLLVVDASNLRRNLYLATQVLELGLPGVIALNMTDVAERRGIAIDDTGLAEAIQCRVVPIVAVRGTGMEALREALDAALKEPQRPCAALLPEVRDAAGPIARELAEQGVPIAPYAIERALIDKGGYAEQRLCQTAGENWRERLQTLRARLSPEQPLAVLESRRRYALINHLLRDLETRAPRPPSWSDRIDRVASHPIAGTLLFLTLMAVVFQSVFAWAAPLMDLLDNASRSAGAAIAARLPAGALTSLITDGVIAGVGSVIVFLPQILILFAFIVFLEDSGYMARAAFIMDRLMRLCGLSGQSFIPMLSSFACAVPGIMATRVIPDARDRLATILAAPFMTCSARLPVYTLLISAFIPNQSYLAGLLNLQGLVLLGLYLLGILGGVGTAWLLKRSALRGPAPSFLMELPPYRLPRLRPVLNKLWERVRMFLVRAGTIIFTVALVIWAATYFPRPAALHEHYQAARAEAGSTLRGDALNARRAEIDRLESATYLEQSVLGRVGKWVAPVFAPVGWDWKVAAAVIASFPAREVVIAVLGTIYAVGAEVEADDTGLIARLQAATWPDGRKVFSTAMAVGLMLFYAFCLQCTATVAVIHRETGSWRWAGGAWLYMTTVGYTSALLCYQIGQRLSG